MKLRIAWAEVRARRGQLSAAVVMIGLGVAVAAGTLMANQALRTSFRASLEALAGNADLQITAMAGGGFSETVLEQVRSIEGVDAAAALLSGIGHVETGDEGDVIRIMGVDLLDDAAVRVFEAAEGTSSVEDPLIFLNQPDSVLIPIAFASTRGLRPGDSLVVETASGTHSLKIHGLIEDTGAAKSFGGVFGVMDIYAAQDLLDLPGLVSQIDVIAGDPVATRARLREALPPHLSIASVAERNAERSKTIQGFQLIQDAVAVMSLLLAALIASNRLATIYQSRLWEIGVMRALGRSPTQVARRLLLEAALLSSVGVVVGLPLGWVMAQWIVDPLAESMFLSFKEIVARPTVAPTASSLLLAGSAGLLSGVAAAWFPARKAASLPVVEILSQARRRDPWPTGNVKLWARRILPPLALAMVLFQVLTTSSALSGIAPIVSICAGALLLQPALRMTATPLARLLGLKRSIGLKDQGRFPSRATGAAGILMVGVAMVLWISSMRESFEEYVTASVMASRGGDLIVESTFNLGADKPRISQALVDRVSALPGAEVVGTEVTTKARSAENGLDLGLHVADAVRLRDQRFGSWAMQSGGREALELVARGEAILANPQLLTNHGKQVGDSLRILTPSGELELPIAGVTTTSFLVPTGDVVLVRDRYQRMWKDSAVIRAFVLLRANSRADEVASAIRQATAGTHKIKIISTLDLHEFTAANVREGFAFMDALALLTLIVVAIGTSDALAADIVERTREIGTLRALGFSPRDVSTMLIAQSLALGVVGVCLGLLVGVALTISYVDGILPDVLGWQLHVRFAPVVAAGVAGVGILACLVGAAVPAIRGARLSPAEALRYE